MSAPSALLAVRAPSLSAHVHRAVRAGGHRDARLAESSPRLAASVRRSPASSAMPVPPGATAASTARHGRPWPARRHRRRPVPRSPPRRPGRRRLAAAIRRVPTRPIRRPRRRPRPRASRPARPCTPVPTPAPTPHPNLCPAQPNGVDPISLLAWAFTPIFQVLFMGLAVLLQPVRGHRHRDRRR